MSEPNVTSPLLISLITCPLITLSQPDLGLTYNIEVKMGILTKKISSGVLFIKPKMRWRFSMKRYQPGLLFILNGQGKLLHGQTLNPQDLLILPSRRQGWVEITALNKTLRLLYVTLGSFHEDDLKLSDNVQGNSAKYKFVKRLTIIHNKDVSFESFSGLALNKIHQDVTWQKYLDTSQWVVGLAYIKAGQELGAHYHSAEEMSYVIDGNAKTKLEHHWVPFHPQTFMYVPSNAVHYTQAINKDFISFWLFPCGPFSSIEYHFK